MKYFYTAILAIIFNLSAETFFYSFSETEFNTAKQDSGSIWVADPIPDQRMDPDDAKSIDITNVFMTEPDSVLISYNLPVSNNNSVVTGNLTYNESTGKLYLDLYSGSVYDTTTVKIKVESKFGDAEDSFVVKVEDPENELFEWGDNYSFAPENCLGNGDSEWKAAVDFDLGSKEYELREIEFGYAMDGYADISICVFDQVPCDSTELFSHTGTDITGGVIEWLETEPVHLSGKISVIFTTTANFMAMDPQGDSGHSWVYPGQGEDSLWVHPKDISDDYAGAWYVRLALKDTATGIEETFSGIDRPHLISNYPNPFNNETVIKWDMSSPGQADINIYNSKGELVRKYNKGKLSTGNHSVVLDSSGLNSGVYYYELTIDGKRAAWNKMLYLK